MLIPWLALHWIVAVIRALASPPFASATVQLSAAGLVGYFALLGTGMLATRRSLPLVGPSLSRLGNALKSSKAITGAASLLLVACPLLFVTLDSLPDGRLHVHFLDVNQDGAVNVLDNSVDAIAGIHQVLPRLGECIGARAWAWTRSTWPSPAMHRT